MNKKILFIGILATALAFIILSCETPAGIDSRDSSEPGTTTLDFNSDGPGYAAFPSGGDVSENNEPSISANSTLLSVSANSVLTAINTALTGGLVSGTMWQTHNLWHGNFNQENYAKISNAGAVGGGALVALAGALLVVNLFVPEPENQTDVKMSALIRELTDVQKSIRTLQTEIREDVKHVQDMITKSELSDYLTQITRASESARYLGGNGMSLAKAESTFMVVDAGINTGNAARFNNKENYADVCRALFSTPNESIDIEANNSLYDAYFTLSHLIIGTERYWTDGLNAFDAYTTYLSKVFNFNTQTFEQRQKFIDSVFSTYSVLTRYLLRAVTYDIDFNVGLREASLEIVKAADSSKEKLTQAQKEERDQAEIIARTTMSNFLYDTEEILDQYSLKPGSITYMNAQVENALKNAQRALRMEEAIAKVPITGEVIDPEDVKYYTDIVDGLNGFYDKYDSLIYSYRLGRYLKADLIEVPAEQYVRYNMGTDYEIADWEKSRFRDVGSLDSVLSNYKLSEDDMSLLNDAAYYRGANIIDDLSGAEFSFNFSLQNSGDFGQNTFYILGMGGAWATSDSGYRKIFEKVIVWKVYAQGPRLDARWTPDGVGDVYFSKDHVWKVLAINFSKRKTSSTAYSEHGNAPPPDPCILVYGDERSLPSVLLQDYS